jgi:hypothetical protein
MNSTTRSRQNANLLRTGFGLVLAAAGLLCGGCATTYNPAKNLELFTRTAPLPQLVDAAKPLDAAEAAAAKCEGDFALHGVGESMAPVYLPGTAVVVHPCNFKALRKGQAVVYLNRRGRYVAHMLVEEMPKGWFAIGLNAAEPDDDLVTTDNLVGVIKEAYAAADTPFRADIAQRIALRDGLARGAALAGLLGSE